MKISIISILLLIISKTLHSVQFKFKTASFISNAIREWNKKDPGIHDVLIFEQKTMDFTNDDELKTVFLEIPTENLVTLLRGNDGIKYSGQRVVSFMVIFILVSILNNNCWNYVKS